MFAYNTQTKLWIRRLSAGLCHDENFLQPTLQPPTRLRLVKATERRARKRECGHGERKPTAHSPESRRQSETRNQFSASCLMTAAQSQNNFSARTPPKISRHAEHSEKTAISMQSEVGELRVGSQERLDHRPLRVEV